MDTYAVDPIWLVCVRQLIASVLFVCLAAAMPADRGRLTEFVRTRGGGLAGVGALVLTALCMMGNSTSYVITISLTNSATATVLQTLGLVLLMLYACVEKRRLPKRRELVGECPRARRDGFGLARDHRRRGDVCGLRPLPAGRQGLRAAQGEHAGNVRPISATVFSVLWLGTVFLPADLAGFVLIIVMVYLTA